MDSREKIEILKVARDIVNQLAVIVRTSNIHDSNNVAVISAIERFVSMVSNVASVEGDLFLELVGEYFFLNETRVKFIAEHASNFDFLGQEFAKTSLGSITFTEAVTVSDMQLLLKSMIAAQFAPEPFEALAQSLEESDNLKVGPLRKVMDDEESLNAKRKVKRTYFNTVSFTKSVMHKVTSGEKINVRMAKRVVQSLVDVLLVEEDLLIGMTAIKDYDDYTFHHSVNVSILAIALGQKLSMPKNVLLDLGMASLFHDTGKTLVPVEILNKPSSFTLEEWKVVRRHPFWGVKSILKMRGFDRSAINAAIVAYEHHIHPDSSGYPAKKSINELDLFSRIVGIADQYDGMTSARVYARAPMNPDRALRLMVERSGTQLDPLIMKFFINLVGVYPVGTLVMLNTRELGLVLSSNLLFPHRPKVLVIMDNKGQKVEGYMVDLSEKDEAGEHPRSVRKTMEAKKYRINLAEYTL